MVCKLSCGFGEFGVGGTEPVVAAAYDNGGFCNESGGLVAFKSRGLGGMVLWARGSGVFAVGVGISCCFSARNWGQPRKLAVCGPPQLQHFGVCSGVLVQALAE